MFKRLFSSFRTNIVAGALSLAPLTAVVWIVAWFWRLIRGLRGLLPTSWDPQYSLGVTNPILLTVLHGLTTLLILSLITLFVAAVGTISRNMLGQRLLYSVHKFIERIPVLRTVYSTLEQLLETFGKGSKGGNFRKVVLIQYPRPGIYALAFVTGERATLPGTKTAGAFVNVFIPTTPNPTSGFFLTLPQSETTEVSLSVEEALKQIISMGIVS